jgi:hypothetical protein
MGAGDLSPGVGQNGRGVKLTTHLYLVPRLRVVELYLSSKIRLHGVVLSNYAHGSFKWTFRRAGLRSVKLYKTCIPELLGSNPG